MSWEGFSKSDPTKTELPSGPLHLWKSAKTRLRSAPARKTLAKSHAGPGSSDLLPNWLSGRGHAAFGTHFRRVGSGPSRPPGVALLLWQCRTVPALVRSIG